MSVLSWFQHYPSEALPYEIGFLLLALSMIWYSMVLKKMVAIIHERPIWILPMIGALFIIASVAMHSIAYVLLLPKMDMLNSLEEINRFSTFMLEWRTWSLVAILMGGLFSLIGGSFYYRWTTR